MGRNSLKFPATRGACVILIATAMVFEHAVSATPTRPGVFSIPPSSAGNGVRVPRRPGHSAGNDASKLWTGSAGTGLWSSANNWTPSGAPVTGDAITFSTQASAYSATNDLFSGLGFASIAFDGAASGRPSLFGGFTTNELTSIASGGATLRSGTYSVATNALLRGQSVVDVSQDASLASAAADATLSLWENSTLNLTSGSSVQLSGSNSVVSIDDAATLHIDSGSSFNSRYALIGNDQTAGPRTVFLDGAGTSMRVDFETLIHTAGYNVPGGVVNIDVRNGATFSSGIVEINENATAAGMNADTNINVDNATFDVSNAIGFANSYFVSGAAAGPGKTTIDLSNGGLFRVSDTDGSGQAFAIFSNSYRADTQVAIGGSNTSGTNSTMQIDGLLFVAPANRLGTETIQTIASVAVNSGGLLYVRDASVFAGDAGYTALLDVRGGAIADLGEQAIFSGGNALSSPSGGAGSTQVLVQGELRAGSFEYLCDSSAVANQGGSTTILVNSSTGRLIADGVDNPLTPEIDSGFFAASRGNGGSDLAVDGTVVFNIEANVEANEAFYAGDLQSGSFTMTLSGSGAVLDAGGLFAVNDRGLPDSAVSVSVTNGASLTSTSFSSGSAGSIRINTKSGSGSAVVMVTSGSTLQSSGSIDIGGRLTSTGPGIWQRTLGTPASLTGDGTILAGSSLYLGAGSTLVSNRYTANGTFIDGSWLVGAGGPEKRVRTGNLQVYSTGSVVFSDALLSNSPALMAAGNLSIEAGAMFDLKNNALLIRPDSTAAATTLATLKQLLDLGRVGTGLGGISSTRLDSSTALGYRLIDAPDTFLGEPTAAGDLLVRFTYRGDADLSGAVGFEDLLVLAQHYGASGEWYTGDFNFDGNVGFDDLLIIAQNYGSSFLADAAGTDTFSADWALAQSLAPEPAAAVVAGAAILFTRRRR